MFRETGKKTSSIFSEKSHKKNPIRHPPRLRHIHPALLTYHHTVPFQTHTPHRIAAHRTTPRFHLHTTPHTYWNATVSRKCGRVNFVIFAEMLFSCTSGALERPVHVAVPFHVAAHTKIALGWGRSRIRIGDRCITVRCSSVGPPQNMRTTLCKLHRYSWLIEVNIWNRTSE